ncbi:hypothetical protein [Peribacillus frigoritolerans]|uniref:hypothetical protein n=1 Tax=Peribacillus frigoritolerans TaxID=450367 RepID=UPI002282A2B6|nr:hypothetical protein [Peribacillus frigoritolerans]MCY8938942.1 hypothetical protein [Peribacillus frigoritolerans]
MLIFFNKDGTLPLFNHTIGSVFSFVINGVAPAASKSHGKDTALIIKALLYREGHFVFGYSAFG